MRVTKMVGRSLGVEHTVVERVRVKKLERGVVVDVGPYSKHQILCPTCLTPCPRYDAGSGRRSWRGHDFGLATVTLEADAPRARCAEHGIHVAHVPWARPGSRFTRPFEDQVAWFVTKTDKTMLATALSIAWRSVGAIVTRVCDEQRALRDPLDGVTRIGFDEVSYRKGHRYLTVVIDHDTGKLIWAAPGRSSATLNTFFRALGKNLAGIQSGLLNGLSNGITESSNNGLCPLTRLAYGFHSPEPLIALAMLKRGGVCPPLPRLTHG